MSEEEGLILEPFEHDGKKVVVVSPSTEGWMTWYTGAGDDLNPTPPASGRGEGTKLHINFTEPDTKEVEIQFSEPVELHDGQLCWDPDKWDHNDIWSFFVRMPATQTTVADPVNTGNCNLVDGGGFNVIVPAAGDGTHDIDLDQAVPIPTSTGYWDTDRSSGEVSASSDAGSAKWHLFDVQVESFFMKNLMLGNPLGVFDIDAYKAEWISERWKMVLKVIRASTGAGDVSGYVMLFRENST